MRKVEFTEPNKELLLFYKIPRLDDNEHTRVSTPAPRGDFVCFYLNIIRKYLGNIYTQSSTPLHGRKKKSVYMPRELFSFPCIKLWHGVQQRKYLFYDEFYYLPFVDTVPGLKHSYSNDSSPLAGPRIDLTGKDVPARDEPIEEEIFNKIQQLKSKYTCRQCIFAYITFVKKEGHRHNNIFSDEEVNTSEMMMMKALRFAFLGRSDFISIKYIKNPSHFVLNLRLDVPPVPTSWNSWFFGY